MEFFSQAADTIVDKFVSKIIDGIKMLKGQHDDEALAEAIHKQLREQYSNELFYNTLDAYLSRYKIVENLIQSMRSPQQYQLIGKTEFIEKNYKRMVEDAPDCIGYKAQIEEIFLYIYFELNYVITDFNSYSDLGRLRSSMMSDNAEIISILLNIVGMLNSTNNRETNNEKTVDKRATVKQVRADNDTYNRMFFAPLFFEDSDIEARKAQLKDVYVPPKYKINVEAEPKRIPIFDMLKAFFCDRDNFTIHQDTSFPIINQRIFAIMLMGKPGAGKSSFVSYLTTREEELTQGRPFYVVRLRNMQLQQINSDDPIHGLLQYLRIQESNLDNSILILDGLDEICAIYNRTDFQTYLIKLLHNLSSVPKLQVVITSRSGYFQINDAIKKVCLVIDIENWDNEDLEIWSQKYANIHPEKEQIIKCNKDHLQNEKFSDKKAIFAVPILFYMANARGEFLERHSSICSVYDSVLTEVAGDRHYDNENIFYTDNLINTNLARQICREIAFAMFRNGRLSMNENSTVIDPFLLPDEVESAINEAIKICDDKRETLSSDDKEKIKHYYALTFFYNNENTKDNAVEFAHKSIAEYFTAEKILELLYSITKAISDEEIGEILAECFGYMPVTNDIMIFVNEKLKMCSNSPDTILLRDRLSRYVVNGAISGSLFVKPKKYESELHYLDRSNIMLRSSLMLFEYLQCNPIEEHSDSSAPFDNIIATISRSIAINPKHNILVPICLNGFNLNEGNFASGDFTDAHFSSTDLSHTDFSDAKLTDAQMSGSNITAANFSTADLDGVDLTNINADSVDFTEAWLRGADLSHSSFTNSSFEYAEFQEADLSYCTFGDGCILKHAVFYGANLSYADICKADIEYINFDSEDEEIEEICEISHLHLTQKQYSYLSAFPHVKLVDPYIVDEANVE